LRRRRGRKFRNELGEDRRQTKRERERRRRRRPEIEQLFKSGLDGPARILRFLSGSPPSQKIVLFFSQI